MKPATQSVTFRRDRFGLERTVDLPVLDGLCETVAMWTSWQTEFPILHAQGRFYRIAKRPTGGRDALALTLQDLSERAELSEIDIDLAGDRFAVLEGRLMAAIARPVWLVRIEDSGNRMHVRQNARQAITMRFSADFGSDFWRSIEPVTTSQPPTVAFSLCRRAEAEALVQSLVSEVPYGDVQACRDRVELLRPELFQADDVAMSIHLVGQMIVALGHTAAPVLGRSAIDEWLALRTTLTGNVTAETAELASIYRHAAAFLGQLRTTEAGTPELSTVLKRARNACALLVKRASADLSAELRAAPEFAADDLELAAAVNL